MQNNEYLEIGYKFDEFILKPNVEQIFMFSAITWNRHSIHYSQKRAQNEGLPDVVVQRALIGNFFSHFLEQAVKENGEVYKLEWKVFNSAIPGDILICSGEVINRYQKNDAIYVDSNIKMVNKEETIISSGVGKIRLF